MFLSSAGLQGRFKAACFILTISGFYSLKETLVVIFADFSLLEHNHVFTDCVYITLTIWKAISLKQICLHCLGMHASFHFETLWTLWISLFIFFFLWIFLFCTAIDYWLVVVNGTLKAWGTCVCVKASVWLKPSWACFRSMYGDLWSVCTYSFRSAWLILVQLEICTILYIWERLRIIIFFNEINIFKYFPQFL